MPIKLPPGGRDRAEKSLCEKSFRDYAICAWSVVEPATPIVTGFHFDAACDHLQNLGPRKDIKRLVIEICPRIGKSTLASVLFPTWKWIERPEFASTRFLTASYADSLATRDAVRSRRVITSPWYQKHWGTRFQLTGDQNVKSRYENDKTGVRLVTSPDGGTTGEGGDFVVVDDPHKVKEVESDTAREGVLRWWDESMMTRRNNLRESALMVIMQRTHLFDLAGHLREKRSEDWVFLTIPMEYSPSRVIPPTRLGWLDPRRAEGELLCPERFGGEEMAKMRVDLGSYAYEAQYNQNPGSRSGSIVKREWFRFWKELPGRAPTWKLVYVDCAFKDLKTSSFVVFQAWHLYDGEFYLVDELHEQLAFTATKAALRTFVARHQPHETLVEDKANGPAIIDELASEIPGLIADEPEGSKEARFAAVSPIYEAGNVLVPDPSIAPWIEDHIVELTRFPAWRWNDRVDAASGSLRRLKTRVGGLAMFIGRSKEARDRDAQTAAAAAGGKR